MRFCYALLSTTAMHAPCLGFASLSIRRCIFTFRVHLGQLPRPHPHYPALGRHLRVLLCGTIKALASRKCELTKPNGASAVSSRLLFSDCRSPSPSRLSSPSLPSIILFPSSFAFARVFFSPSFFSSHNLCSPKAMKKKCGCVSCRLSRSSSVNPSTTPTFVPSLAYFLSPFLF